MELINKKHFNSFIAVFSFALLIGGISAALASYSLKSAIDAFFDQKGITFSNIYHLSWLLFSAIRYSGHNSGDVGIIPGTINLGT
jgi:hypothetical protein